MTDLDSGGNIGPRQGNLSARVRVEAVIQNLPLVFETAPRVFSPTAVDRGTLLLLSLVRFDRGDKVLDLGCGYGVMGIYAAKLLDPQNVYMLDNDPEALRLAATNVELNRVCGAHVNFSEGFGDLRESAFTKILCNPPYHSDFSVAKHFIEKGFNRLTIGGEMWMVTKRERWYRNKLASVFGGVQVIAQDSYFVFHSTKKSNTYASRAYKAR
jgi:16S rRNA (guanine1207-N2)-methyltransferase